MSGDAHLSSVPRTQPTLRSPPALQSLRSPIETLPTPRSCTMQLPFLSALLHIANTALSSSNNFYGVDISSFNANGQCRNPGMFVEPDTVIRAKVDSPRPPAEWDSIVSNAKNNGYKRFRIYGNDCGTSGSVFRLRASMNFSHRNNFRLCHRFCQEVWCSCPHWRLGW